MAAKKKTPAARNPLQREVSAGGVICRRDTSGAIEVVLVRPAGRDSWVLPKGHLEPRETIAEAAVRETREETGLDVSIRKPLGEVSYFFSHRAQDGPPIRVFKRVHFFLMECAGGNIERHDHEIDEVRWLSVADASKLASYENERILLQRAATELGA